MTMHDGSNLIPLQDFEFAWRITNPKWAALSDTTLARIKPLSDVRSKQILEESPLRGGNGLPFDPARYHATQDISLQDSESDCIRQWYRNLPIAPDQQVFVAWQVGDGVAVITDWGTFMQVWHDLWYPFDRMAVFDQSQDWALLLGPEEHAVFVERGAVNPALPKSHSAYGMCLFQASGLAAGAGDSPAELRDGDLR